VQVNSSWMDGVFAQIFCDTRPWTTKSTEQSLDIVY
jgi:hypothetical protein